MFILKLNSREKILKSKKKIIVRTNLTFSFWLKNWHFFVNQIASLFLKKTWKIWKITKDTQNPIKTYIKNKK
jgi:hypothetical protein